MKHFHVILLLVVTIWCSFIMVQGLSIYCEGETVNITCSAFETIYISYAFYGKKNSTLCLGGTNFPNCTAYSQNLARFKIAQQCGVNNSCVFKPTNNFFGMDPCNGNKKYVELVHECMIKSFNLMTSNEINYLMSLSNTDLSGCITNCSNSGQCISTNLGLKCSCNENYTGNRCQIDRRPCSYYPCLNGGTCTNNFDNVTNSYSFACTNCNYPYYGEFCEQKIDLCQNLTCSNRGVCHEVDLNATCKCYNFFSGENCEIESQEFKYLKTVKQTSSKVAVIILFGLLFLVFVIDIFDYYLRNCHKKDRNVKK